MRPIVLSLVLVSCTAQHRAVVRDTAELLNTAADLAEVVCADIDDPDLCAARCLEEAKKQP